VKWIYLLGITILIGCGSFKEPPDSQYRPLPIWIYEQHTVEWGVSVRILDIDFEPFGSPDVRAYYYFTGAEADTVNNKYLYKMSYYPLVMEELSPVGTIPIKCELDIDLDGKKDAVLVPGKFSNEWKLVWFRDSASRGFAILQMKAKEE